MLHYSTYANEFQMMFRYQRICLHGVLKHGSKVNLMQRWNAEWFSLFADSLIWPNKQINSKKTENTMTCWWWFIVSKEGKLLYVGNFFFSWCCSSCWWIHTWLDLQYVLMSSWMRNKIFKSNANFNFWIVALTLHSNGFPVVILTKVKLVKN